MTTRAHILGPVLMVSTMALYVANDTMAKLLGQGGMPFAEIFALRSFFILLFTFAVVLLLPGHGIAALRWITHRAILLRAVLGTAVTIFYLLAVLHMPIANAIAILNLTPLAILALSMLFLGERPGPRRLVAIIAGFIGALIVVRPGAEGFNIWALAAFAAVLSIATRDLVTRKAPAEAPSLAMALAAAVVIQIMALVLWALAPVKGHLPSPDEWLKLAAAGAFLGAAQSLIIITVRIAPMHITVPWRYTILMFGVLAGWLVFGQFPDALTLAGIVIIGASSLYATLRHLKEQRLAEKQARRDVEAQPGNA